MTGPFDWYGFNVTAWTQNGFTDLTLVRKGLDYAKAEGANFIAIDYAVNFDSGGAIIPPAQSMTPSLSDIATVLAEAKARGFTVFLKPHAAAASGENLNTWNVDLTKFSLDRFFVDWKGYITSLATFATSNGVDGLFIGTEQNAFDTANRSQWADIISAVRQNFSGYVTYDALINVFKSSPDVADVSFLDLLDFISVSMYAPLSQNSRDPSVLDQAWLNNPQGDVGNIVQYLEGIAREYGKQIFFGESGFQSVSDGLWNTNSLPAPSKTVDNQAQVLGLQSLFNTWTKYRSDWLKGLSLWQITPSLLSDSGLASIYNTQEFTTYGKPGAQVVKDWFTGINTYSDLSYTGTLSNDYIVASFGNDAIRGDTGNDTLKGGAGNDTIYGNGIPMPTSTLIQITANADILDNVGPQMNVILDGVTILQGREIKTSRATGSEEVTISLPYQSSISSLNIVFTNEAYQGPGLDRNLYITNVVIDGIALSQTGSVYTPLFDPPTPDTWTMGQGGSLSVDVTPAVSVKQQAAMDNNVLQGGDGNDTLIGGDGTDTVIMGGIVSQYQFSQNGGYTVVTSHEGMDTLAGVDYVRFGSSIYTTDVPISDATTSEPVHLAKQITDLYVAYFNRGPDAEGFDYWFHEIYTATKSLRGIAEDFSWSNEYRSMYPGTLTNRQFVEQIYQNLFDRAPDQGGWDYWTGRLDTGSVLRSGFILNAIDGAYAPTSGPEDRALIDNKHDASLYYTGQLALHPQEGYDLAIVDLLNRVTGNVNTAMAAERVMDYAFDDPITLTGVMTNPALLDSLWANG